MRTTIEITPEQRVRLLEMAARRGDKGFSKIVREALDVYLQTQASEGDKRRRVLLLKGALGADEADGLRAVTREIRGSWR